MVEILEGKFRKVSIEDGNVKLEIEGKKLNVSNKSMWALLRRHYGRNIDEEIKEERYDSEDWKRDFSHFFVNKMKKVSDEQRILQYIIDEEKKRLVAVATTKHSLMTKGEVYKIINTKIRKMGLETETEESAFGKLVFLKRTDYADYGLQIVAGDITTQHAISITMFVRARGMGLGCLNPLSFMGLNRMINRKILGDIPMLESKILRVENGRKLPMRIKSSIESMRPHVKKMSEMVSEEVEYPGVNYEQARVLLGSMCSSYGIGYTVTQECLNEFKENERSTKGLSMSTSTVTKHKSNVFKKGTVKARQHLSDISGALLLINDVKGSVSKCKEYMKDREDVKNLYEKLI